MDIKKLFSNKEEVDERTTSDTEQEQPTRIHKFAETAEDVNADTDTPIEKEKIDLEGIEETVNSTKADEEKQPQHFAPHFVPRGNSSDGIETEDRQDDDTLTDHVEEDNNNDNLEEDDMTKSEEQLTETGETKSSLADNQFEEQQTATEETDAQSVRHEQNKEKIDVTNSVEDVEEGQFEESPEFSIEAFFYDWFLNDIPNDIFNEFVTTSKDTGEKVFDLESALKRRKEYAISKIAKIALIGDVRDSADLNEATKTEYFGRGGVFYEHVSYFINHSIELMNAIINFEPETNDLTKSNWSSINDQDYYIELLRANENIEQHQDYEPAIRRLLDGIYNKKLNINI